MSERFDRAMALLDAPDVRSTRAATIVANNALLGHSGTHVVQTAFEPDNGFTMFLQIIDANGVTQIVLPDRVCRTMLRQMRSAAARPRRKLTPDEIKRKRLRDARKIIREAKGR